MKLFIEYQYFEGCPNHHKLLQNLQKAIEGFEDSINLSLINIENEEMAKKHKFRGSPTILLNGNDIEDMPAPYEPRIACRFYPEGLPTTEKIRLKISSLLNK